jgi:hypothetical protein
MNTSAAINTIARAIARDAVKQEIWDRGRKLSDFTLGEFAELVQTYLALCPEVYDQAIKMIESDPRLRRLCKS